MRLIWIRQCNAGEQICVSSSPSSTWLLTPGKISSLLGSVRQGCLYQTWSALVCFRREKTRSDSHILDVRVMCQPWCCFLCSSLHYYHTGCRALDPRYVAISHWLMVWVMKFQGGLFRKNELLDSICIVSILKNTLDTNDWVYLSWVSRKSFQGCSDAVVPHRRPHQSMHQTTFNPITIIMYECMNNV